MFFKWYLWFMMLKKVVGKQRVFRIDILENVIICFFLLERSLFLIELGILNIIINNFGKVVFLFFYIEYSIK